MSLPLYPKYGFLENAYANLERLFYALENIESFEEQRTYLQKYKTSKYELNLMAGDFYYKHKNYDSAKRRYALAMAAEPKKDKSYFKLIKVFEHLREYRKAELVYQQLIEQIPDYAQAYRLLALLYHKNMNLPQKAKSKFEKYLALRPEAQDRAEILQFIEEIDRIH